MSKNTKEDGTLPPRTEGPHREGAPCDGGRKKRVRIVVVDDHKALRQLICRLIAEEPDLQVVGQAADGCGAVALAHELIPDVVLMDVDMPNLNGVEATRQITRDLPAVRVVAMSGDWCDAKRMGMLNAGAAGCLSKAVPFEVFLQAVRTVSSGRTLSADGGRPDSV